MYLDGLLELDVIVPLPQDYALVYIYYLYTYSSLCLAPRLLDPEPALARMQCRVRGQA